MNAKLKISIYLEDYMDQSLFAQLVFYQSDHKEALYAFELPPEQQQFTGMPHDVLESAVQDIHQYPVVIVSAARPVGFFILYDGETRQEYTDNARSLILRSFSINYAEQGKGYAKQSLLQLKDFVRRNFHHVEEVALAVNMRNASARSVYLKTGFIDEGRTRMGPKGPQYLMVLPIER